MTLGQISGLLLLIGGSTYIWQTLTGKVRPERATWFVYFTLGMISLWGQRAAGGTDSLWLTISQNLMTGIIFIISIFRGVGGLTKFDFKCLGLATLGVLLWALSRQPAVAILGVVFADAMGTLPTIRKAYKDPESESLFSWGIDIPAALLGVLSVGTLNIALLLYPGYLVVSISAVFVAILLGYKQKKSAA